MDMNATDMLHFCNISFIQFDNHILSVIHIYSTEGNN